MTDQFTASERVVIVGGGVSGLSIAVRIAQSGLPVTLLEAAHLGFAASTRNQGWLHSGGVFALEHPELARLCYESMAQTLQFCPDCLEPQCGPMAYLFSRPDHDADRWTAAWKRAGIPFMEMQLEELFGEIGGLDRRQVYRAFALPDRAVRWGILLERLAGAARNAGVEIRTNTTVVELLQNDDRIDGVRIGSGEAIRAGLVVLAGNAFGLSLWEESRDGSCGDQPEFECVPLKTHLLAVTPELSRRPFCVVDADGFNHIPHEQTSVFGIDKWHPVSDPLDESVEPEHLERITEEIDRFFPDWKATVHEQTSWAGCNVQEMRFEQTRPGAAPLPTVVDYETEPPCVKNLISVFPGRATLWAELAEQTRQTVLNKFQRDALCAEPPPWETLIRS